MPFLTVITRTVARRGELLARNQKSLAEQVDPDYQQLVIMDEDERGVNWANGMMASRAWGDIQGDYVMVLDDDDELANPRVIHYLKAHNYGQDLYIVRMDHGPRGILPSPGAEIKKGGIGCSGVIPKRELFLKAVKHYRPAYDGDYDYIQACLDLAWGVTRLNYVASKVMQIGALVDGG